MGLGDQVGSGRWGWHGGMDGMDGRGWWEIACSQKEYQFMKIKMMELLKRCLIPCCNLRKSSLDKDPIPSIQRRTDTKLIPRSVDYIKARGMWSISRMLNSILEVFNIVIYFRYRVRKFLNRN